MNELCVKMRFTPQKVVTFRDPSTRYLYAGGSVLDAFYGTDYTNDIDIFVPCVGDPPENLSNTFSYDTSKYEVGGYWVGYYGSVKGVKTVIKMREKASKKSVLDIVFMNVESLDITTEDFHKMLVNNFDIPICALAWDGNKLYYPPKALANLDNKSSIVRNKGSHIPDRSSSRVKKYLARGFKLFSENFDREIS